LAVTEQPGTRHLPYIERDPEFWSLEERRWQAAEAIMRQKTGSCLVSIDGGAILPVSVPRPRPFYVRSQVEAKLTAQFFARHSLPREQAEEIAGRRQQAFLAAALAAPQLLSAPKRKNRGSVSSRDQTDSTEAFDELLGRD
jgi:hypothetical protein